MERTYKTSEVFAELEKSPKLTFVCNKGNREFFITTETAFNTFFKLSTKKNGRIVPQQQNVFFGNITLNDTWQLAQEPVTWQEGIQGYLDGKTVAVHCERCNISSDPDICVLKGCNHICPHGIKNGTWYIEDSADE